MTSRTLIGCTLTIGLIITSLAVASADRNTMWYRGYFDGEVQIKGGDYPGFYYKPSRPTAYPLHEEQYSEYLPCDKCRLYHWPGVFVPQLGRVCDGNGTHLDPDLVYVPAPHQLPGQYWYEKQNHYTFRPPHNLGWPYWKYDQRTETTGAIPMGRSMESRLNSRSRYR